MMPSLGGGEDWDDSFELDGIADEDPVHAGS